MPTFATSYLSSLMNYQDASNIDKEQHVNGRQIFTSIAFAYSLITTNNFSCKVK